jgi:hypothetical protein
MKENICVTAGSKFGIPEGHTFIIEKAIYDLRTPGASWHKKIQTL